MPSAVSSSSYRALWRWHFFAGLFVAPTLILLALTGALYLFDREIEGWWHRDMLRVTIRPPALSLGQQQAAVTHAFPQAAVLGVIMPRAPGEASKWLIEEPSGRAISLFVDPYRAVITGQVDPGDEPMSFVRKIHATLLGGQYGRYIVELVACWTLIMLVTGAMMWWPRRWKMGGTLIPRLSAGGRRFWRDLHSIPAALNMMFIMLLILTGLPWSVFWGDQLARLGAVVPFAAPTPNFGAPVPKLDDHRDAVATGRHAGHRAETGEALPWVIQHSAQPVAAGGMRIGIARIEPYLARLDQQRYGGAARIVYPEAAGIPFIISYTPDQAQGQRTIYLDPGDGALIADIGWDDYSLIGKAIEWGTMLHMGRQYGRVNQIANLLVCLMLIGSVVAGLILWWRRRPPGRLGAPQVQAGEGLPRPTRRLLIALAVLFPLVGISLLIILAINWLVSARAAG